MDMLGNLRKYKDIVFARNINYSSDENHKNQKPAELDDATVVSSEWTHARGYHTVAIDLDVPAWLVRSSTNGHSHLYIEADIHKDDYIELLRQLAKCGVIERGYYEASKKRGASYLRLPWIKKGAEHLSNPDKIEEFLNAADPEPEEPVNPLVSSETSSSTAHTVNHLPF